MDVHQHLSQPAFENSMSTKEYDTLSITRLLPATFRTKGDHLDIPESDIEGFLRKELSVERLDKVHEWLWMSGRPVPPRPLHHQVLLRRSLTITEQPDLHLVWNKDRIFIKPLPPFLLDSEFWKTHLCTFPVEGDQTSRAPLRSFSSHNTASYSRIDLAKAARGLLFSYVALIVYPSDFNIAKENGLIHGVSWDEWKKISQNVTRNHTYDCISPRYRYGELRLSRLNKIYRFRLGAIMRGFSRIDYHSHYAGFFAENFGKVIAVSGYVVVVLTAMQVGLATTQLQSNDAFQSASYGLTVFSITAPIGGAVVILMMFLCLFTTNWAFMRREYYSRLMEMKKWDHNSRYSSEEFQD